MKDDQEQRKLAISVTLHKKLPERVFGYLDFLIKRPNSSAAVNEAQVLYTFNKTSKLNSMK